MKKLLLILSLVASVSSVSAADKDASTAAPSRWTTTKNKAAAAWAACTAANARALPAKGFNQATKTKTRAGISTVAVTAVVAVAAKKAYDRYKAWKKAKADKKEEVTA